MENKTLIHKLYDIARATRTTDEYISYIEYVLQGNSFSASDLANKIYKAAMIKREASIHKRASDIKVNSNSLADQMHNTKEFARAYGLMFDYAFYLEGLVLSREQFDINGVLNHLSIDAVTNYGAQLRRKIESSTGITIIEG